jgi:methionine sulfoxide reductase catalytic subunit
MTKIDIPKIPSSEITPEHVYINRRQFMRGVGLTAGALALAACATPGAKSVPATAPSASASPAGGAAPAAPTAAPSASKQTDELGDPLTTYDAVTTYNNYYEFSTDKSEPAILAKDFKVQPWTVQIGGLVNKPGTFGVEDLTRMFPPEERIYRLRCVEAWSMVIPWLGFQLSSLLKAVEPTSDAKYVRFTTLMDPMQMPGQRSPYYQWPYVEGLRLDEAMNDLAILATGLYGKPTLLQNGAPIRLVVPWKYGFKSIKAIVKIDLVTEQPTSLWMAAAPDEYGFYANVNPSVSHPRWSQTTERRIGETGRRATHMFNGYEQQVAGLYAGMDLATYY